MHYVSVMAKHLAILGEAREKLEMAYVMAVERGLERPMVLVLNLLDPVARRTAESLGRKEYLRSMMEEAVLKGTLPLAIYPVPTSFVLNALSEIDPCTADSLVDDPAKSDFHTVVISNGRASVHPTPIVE